jgi:Tfp pilus assembly PilM family ATPase
LTDPESFTIADAPSPLRPGLKQEAAAVESLRAIRNATVVGIDIGTGAAKAVVLETHRRTREILVREFAIEPIRTAGQPLAITLRSLLGRLKTRSRDCAFAFWPASAEVRFLQSSQRRSGAGHTGGTAAAGSQDAGSVFDAAMIPRSERGDEETSLLECGMSRADLQAIDDAFREMRCRLQLVQLTPVAIFNAFVMAQVEVALRDPYLMVDIGRTRTTLIAGGEGAMRLMRVVDLGWEFVAEPLELEFGIDCRSALQGLPADDPLVRSSTSDAVRPLAEEIAQSLDHLQMEENIARPTRFYISGPLNAESLPVQALSEHLGLMAIPWNPLRRMAAGKRALAEFRLLQDLARLPAAAGAALQCLI